MLKILKILTNPQILISKMSTYKNFYTLWSNYLIDYKINTHQAQLYSPIHEIILEDLLQKLPKLLKKIILFYFTKIQIIQNNLNFLNLLKSYYKSKSQIPILKETQSHYKVCSQFLLSDLPNNLGVIVGGWFCASRFVFYLSWQPILSENCFLTVWSKFC